MQTKLSMQRINITLDDETQALLNTLANRLYGGNKSLTIREALQSLAAHVSQEGWIVSGYVPVAAAHEDMCHSCGRVCHQGDVFYRPVFERGSGHNVLAHLPASDWLECQQCAERQIAG